MHYFVVYGMEWIGFSLHLFVGTLLFCNTMRGLCTNLYKEQLKGFLWNDFLFLKKKKNAVYHIYNIHLKCTNKKPCVGNSLYIFVGTEHYYLLIYNTTTHGYYAKVIYQ